MAKRAAAKKKPQKKQRRIVRRMLFWAVRGLCCVFVLIAAFLVLYIAVNPPTTIYMSSEGRRLGKVQQEWVALELVAPVMVRAVVAAEDANFCNHWGFDVIALKKAIAEGGNRGASTISQQVVKNVYLWHGRNYTRKALEALITPLMEALWSKRRIIEVYLNVAEFDEGVFGVKAAARHYFGVTPDKLSATQAARLAAILPDPKGRSASKPSNFVTKRARQIRDGAATIRADGRAACFES